MSDQPNVLCVCVTADRPQFEAQMLESFRSQTYQRKDLLIYDTGAREFSEPLRAFEMCIHTGAQGRTIGALRNAANQQRDGWDIIAHLDVDDWSHPNRITEQVALLQASGADVVGYHEMLFGREVRCGVCDGHGMIDATMYTEMDPHDIQCGACGGKKTQQEAWLYQNDTKGRALGTSLCYWRKTWEAKKFNPQLPRPGGGMGEDSDWLMGLNVVTESSLVDEVFSRAGAAGSMSATRCEPRMIARIHGGNTSKCYDIEQNIARGCNAKPGSGWYRKPEWDERIREILK